MSNKKNKEFTSFFFPNELFIQIFEFIEPSKLLIYLKLTCKRFKELIESTYFRKYLLLKYFPLEKHPPLDEEEEGISKEEKNNIKLYSLRNTFKTSNLTKKKEKMYSYESNLKIENNRTIIIKKNLLKFYFKIIDLEYKTILYSKNGFSIYNIIEFTRKFIDKFTDNYSFEKNKNREEKNHIITKCNNMVGYFSINKIKGLYAFYLEKNKMYKVETKFFTRNKYGGKFLHAQSQRYKSVSAYGAKRASLYDTKCVPVYGAKTPKKI